MLHLIAYDIAAPRRLHKVARICEDYGMRVEKSVFECHLSDGDFKEFWSRISGVVTGDDRVVDYPIGLLDSKKIKCLGRVERIEPKETYIF